MNGPPASPAPAPEPEPAVEEVEEVEEEDTAPEVAPAAPATVSPEAQAASTADDTASKAAAKAALDELYADSMAVVATLKEGDKPKIPIDMEVTANDIAALKEEGIQTAEQLTTFFEGMPTVEDVKKVKTDLVTKDMKLKDWVQLLKELKKPTTSGGDKSDEDDEGGFLSGLGAVFGKIGKFLKDFFGKLKGLFAGLFGKGENPAEEAEATREAEALLETMQPKVKKFTEKGILSDKMTLDEMGVRSLNSLGISSAQELDDFLVEQAPLEEIVAAHPEVASRIESGNMTVDAYISYLNTLPAADAVDDTADDDVDDTADDDVDDTADDTADDAADDTADDTADDAADDTEPIQQGPKSIGDYFFTYPKLGKTKVTSKTAERLSLKEGGPDVVISKSKIKIGSKYFQMRFGKEDGPKLSVVGIERTNTNMNLTLDPNNILAGPTPVPMTLAEAHALIKKMQDSADQDSFFYPTPKPVEATGKIENIYFVPA